MDRRNPGCKRKEREALEDLPERVFEKVPEIVNYDDE